MINSEVLELKKRFRKDKVSFYRVAGCYVNEKKEKVYSFNRQFLNLPDDEMFKYLEIVTKTLSGKIGNNLLNIEFPIEEEKDGGAQERLYTLINSEADDEDLLNKFYDKIIETYQHLNHYLILLFFDKYDVPMKTKDNQKLDDSEEVFHHFICSLCPVELTQPSLGYIDQKTGLTITNRDWVVQLPETGFMFPAFNDRSTDVHSLLFYTKNAKLPHMEIVEDMLGCECLMTSTQKKSMFNDVISTQLCDMPDDEIANIIIDMEYNLQQMIDAHKAEHGETAVLKMKASVIESLVENAGIPDEKIDGCIDAFSELFEEENTDASILISQKNLKLGEVRSEKQAIANALSKTTKELEEYKERENSDTNKYEKKVIDGVEYMLIPNGHGTKIIHGIEYILVPTKNIK